MPTPADQSSRAGGTVSLSVSASDTASGTLSYSASDLPSGLSINSGTGVISGTASAGGAWEPTVTAGDGTYSATTSFFLQVISPITITHPRAHFSSLGDTASLTLNARDTPSGPPSYS